MRPTIHGNADWWANFRAAFTRIANEEAKYGTDRLSATLTYIDGASVIVKAQGPLCVNDHPKLREWRIHGKWRPIKDGFSHTASNVVRVFPGVRNANDWLFALFRALQVNTISEGNTYFKRAANGGTILRVSEASAILCSYYEGEAINLKETVKPDKNETQQSDQTVPMDVPTPHSVLKLQPLQKEPSVRNAPTRSGEVKRRGYHAEVREWMKRNDIPSVANAAKRLAISKTTLISIMADHGDIRYSEEKLQAVLRTIKPPKA